MMSLHISDITEMSSLFAVLCLPLVHWQQSSYLNHLSGASGESNILWESILDTAIIYASILENYLILFLQEHHMQN